MYYNQWRYGHNRKEITFSDCKFQLTNSEDGFEPRCYSQRLTLHTKGMKIYMFLDSATPMSWSVRTTRAIKTYIGYKANKICDKSFNNRTHRK